MKNKTPFTVALVAAVALIASGCASLQTMFADIDIEKLDAIYQEWLAKYEAEGGTFGNVVDVVTNKIEEAQEDPATSVDAVAFSSLAWSYGGFNGASAALDSPRISSLAVSGSGLSLKWDTDLAAWGLGDKDADAVAALFCRVNGQWRGGKFDWISKSRATRDFKNINGGYHGWRSSDIGNADAFAFVVVSKNGKRRTNVITCKK